MVSILSCLFLGLFKKKMYLYHSKISNIKEECVKHFNSLHLLWHVWFYSSRSPEVCPYVRKMTELKISAGHVKTFWTKRLKRVSIYNKIEIWTNMETEEENLQSESTISNKCFCNFYYNRYTSNSMSTATRTRTPLLRVSLLSLPPSTVITLTPPLKEEKVK